MRLPRIKSITTRNYVSEVTLPVPCAAEPTILLGDNGAGKTTAFTLLSLLSLGNVATAFETSILEASFLMLDGDSVSVSTPLADPDDMPIMCGLSDSDEQITVRQTANNGRTRETSYLCSLAESELRNWAEQDPLVDRLVETIDLPRHASVKQIVDPILAEQPVLDGAITSMLACGYPSDFRSNTALDVPAWFRRFLHDNPVRLLGVHRLGIPLRRMVHEQLRTTRDRAQDTLWYLAKDWSGKEAAASAVGSSLHKEPEDWDALSSADILAHMRERAADTRGWDIVDATFTGGGDAPLSQRRHAYVRFVSAYLGPHRATMWSGLSSGEQHIVSMFYAILLSVPPGTVVLIDEPELSLHVSWQLSIARDLAEAAALRGCRVILATHSPAIVNDWWDNVVEMGS